MFRRALKIASCKRPLKRGSLPAPFRGGGSFLDGSPEPSYPWVRAEAPGNLVGLGMGAAATAQRYCNRASSSACSNRALPQPTQGMSQAHHRSQIFVRICEHSTRDEGNCMQACEQSLTPRSLKPPEHKTNKKITHGCQITPTMADNILRRGKGGSVCVHDGQISCDSHDSGDSRIRAEAAGNTANSTA